MLIILAAGAAFGGWAALAMMGAERARRLTQIEAQRPVVPTMLTSPSAPSTPAAKAPARRKLDAPAPAAAQKPR
jgi:hypothetical protein